MAYLQLLGKPYRGNLGEEIATIMEEDLERLNRAVPEICLIWFIGYFLMIPLSILKIIHYMFAHFKKPVQPIFGVNRTLVDRELESDMQLAYAVREARVLSTNEAYARNQGRVNALTNLRKHLYYNNLILKGRILKEINHKVSDHDFVNSIISGEEVARFTTTYITFGKDINNMLALLLSSKPKKKKIKGVECLAFENDYGYMVQELREIYQEPVKVQLDS